ncbi:MAG: two-component system response regulator [Sedimenticola sp.]|nr:MAG: two-component system response regulator [Sedimenticola sp.]
MSVQQSTAKTDRNRSAAAEQKTRILIVDDEPRLCNSLKVLLELRGYSCDTATGGVKALQTLRQSSFDIMLLDLKMPELDGHQVMDYVKTSLPDLDVIIVSGETTFDEATWAYQQGAQDFLRKPYAAGELIRSIEKVVNRRILERENKKLHRELLNSEQQHRFFVNSSPDIIYMLDKDGRFSFVNDRICTLLGYSTDEILGKHYSEIVFQEDLKKIHFNFPEQRTGSRASRGVEFRLVHKNNVKTANFAGFRTVTVELTSMGVYSWDRAKSRRFLGTYGVIRDISERKQAEEIINYQLYHDLLTSLPNRTLFRDRMAIALSQVKRTGKKLAVMYLDLDGFKVINDSLGHLVGDELLQAVALRLNRTLRDSDTLARVGGDEFNLLLPEIGNADDAAVIAEKIIEALKSPFLINGHELSISISIGIAIYPDDGGNIETLIRNADMAMYHIKGRGKNGYEFFTNNMISRVSHHYSLESGLRKALDEGQFRLFFQPQQELLNGRFTGVESLIRWQHPQEGLIYPDDFIPLAEETGLITDLGEWVINASCAELGRWRKAGLVNIKMAVNLAAAQLYRTDFVEKVFHALDKNKIPGECLELEITENVLMQDMENVVQKLHQLTARGIGIAVDDFGTGYSSLGYLQSLPLSKLKIDRSFVNKIQSIDEKHSIVSAIVAMAKDLGLNLTAEGVETDVQLNYLKSIQCPQVQGFLISPPLSPEKVFSRL